ncbi:PELOTA RNA binding domain-containing protein [Rhodoblastus acidophilus]|uniref:PELOTA RNA binding domain-containing protein n=1 Tax=Rhodoblastus acidophilus TaxID=1074 RepID=A0A212SG40_RHOAC|nr:cysteine protease StiP domain-containing protein [Rhodoblastus acidophilus]PPQ34830.1 hypothetical protein CKO16_21825 [Rhodoblastus acidophilus]RAI16604.1 hypothetical protein CH337_20540 [Rhodoblastus acidophilus]SNB84560.1 PELOTA RNA binding domain-containing protein [Rhodoblastus acidophilus]
MPTAASTPALHGSYDAADIAFLLKPVTIRPTDVPEKERLIQSGVRHYSEMIGFEQKPTSAYEAIFAAALRNGAPRLGRDIAAVAKALQASATEAVTLASLVRAGAPIGVLLTRALKRLDVDVAHFGISVIRDRGMDQAALDHILCRRPPSGLFFVDGWTGKGAIASELERTLARTRPEIAPRLVVVADPCGRAWLSASGDDWLIPSGILGATVSGLISRSILNDDVVSPGEFHGCMVWGHLKPHDRTQDFIDAVWPQVEAALAATPAAVWPIEHRTSLNRRAAAVIDAIAVRHGVSNPNRIKPGIAEATRAILRRVPERVFVDDPEDSDLAALIHLAGSANVPVEPLPCGVAPYRAVTLIKSVS